LWYPEANLLSAQLCGIEWLRSRNEIAGGALVLHILFDAFAERRLHAFGLARLRAALPKVSSNPTTATARLPKR
jgi:hypothetical protein